MDDQHAYVCMCIFVRACMHVGRVHCSQITYMYCLGFLLFYPLCTALIEDLVRCVCQAFLTAPGVIPVKRLNSLRKVGGEGVRSD